MTQINVPDDAFHDVIQKAILDSVTTEQRDAIIGEAVKYLTTAKRDPYGRTEKTPLQEAFEISMRQAVFKVVGEMIDDDPEVRGVVVGEIENLVRDFAVALDAEKNPSSAFELRATIVEAMVNKLADLRADGRY